MCLYIEKKLLCYELTKVHVSMKSRFFSYRGHNYERWPVVKLIVNIHIVLYVTLSYMEITILYCINFINCQRIVNFKVSRDF